MAAASTETTQHGISLEEGVRFVPYVSLAEEEASGIVALMRAAPDKSLQILEQAKFVVELLTIHDMRVADVAESLSRSNGWVWGQTTAESIPSGSTLGPTRTTL